MDSEWSLTIKTSADKEASALPESPRKAFRELLGEIVEDPYDVAGSRAFRSLPNTYIVNFYVSYRAVFRVFPRKRSISIIAVGHRDAVYKGMPNPTA